MRVYRFLCAGATALVAVLAAACGGNVTTGAGGHTTTGTSSTSSGTATSTSGGMTCGGLTGTPCPPGQFCNYPDKQCGNADGSGTCTPDPQGCNDIYMPACGCDGKVYGNDCSAQMMGVDVNDLGGCQPPAGRFACGSHFCMLGADYCQMTASDVGGTPSSYNCLPLPAGCGTTPSCACLSAMMCGGTCKPTADGGLLVTCPGG